MLVWNLLFTPFSYELIHSKLIAGFYFQQNCLRVLQAEEQNSETENEV